MARKAEFVFVGDASSVIRAASQAQHATSKLAKGTESAHTRIRSSFGAMAKRAITAGAGFAGAYASIAGAKSAIDTTQELAHTTIGLNKNLGLSVAQASRWAAVAKSRGIESKALSQSFGILAKNSQAATHGGKAQTEAFKALGVSQTQLKSQNFDGTLKGVADGLMRMKPGAERTALSMKLFGRGWQTVVPLLRGGSKAMQQQLNLADKYGVTFKGKTVKSLHELVKAQRESKFATMGLQVAFGTMLAPAMTKGLNAVNRFVVQARDGTGAGGQLAKAGRMVWHAFQPVVSVLKAAGRTLLAHPALIAAAVTAFAGFKVVSKIAGTFRSLRTAMVGLKIAKTLATGFWALDAAMAANPVGIVVVGIAALAAGLIYAYKHSEKFRKIVDGAFNAVKTIASKVFPVIGKLIKVGLLGPIPLIISHWKDIKKVPGMVLGFFRSLPDRMLRIGKNVVSGLANGIADGAKWVIDKVKELAGKIPSTIGKLLKILSPSRVMYGIGLNIAQGLADGIKAGAGRVHAGVSVGLLFPLDAAIRDLEARKAALEQAGETTGGAAGTGGTGGGGGGGGRGAASRGSGPDLSWAKGSVGRFRESTGSNTGPQLDRLQREFGMRAQAWCAMWATKALVQAGAPKSLKGAGAASVATIRGWAQAGSHGLQRGVKQTGRAGDLMAFGSGHIGIVEKVIKGMVHTIEGNTGKGLVARRTHRMTDGDFFRPKFAGGGGGTELVSAQGRSTSRRAPAARQPHGVAAQALAAASAARATPKQTLALIEAGIVESGMRNLSYGDRDSVGFLQQRPSMGWKGLRNPGKAAAEFLRHAKQVKGQGGLSAGQLAQKVQGSAFPARYDQVHARAERIIAAHKSAGLTRGFDGAAIGSALNSTGAGRVSAKTGEIAAIQVRIDGLTRLRDFRASIKDLRDNLAGKLSDAVDKFRTRWEETAGKIFDQQTDKIVAQTAAGRELQALRGTDEATSRVKEDADNQKALADAQYQVAHSGGKAHQEAVQQVADAQEQINATARKRREDVLEAQVAAETDQIQAARAIQRQAQMDAEAAAFLAAEQKKAKALSKGLESRRLSYADYVTKVNELLRSLGVDAIEATPQQEAVITAGDGRDSKPRKKAAKRHPAPKKHAAVKRKHAIGGLIARVGELGPEDIHLDQTGGLRVHQASQSARGGGASIVMTGPVHIGSERAARVMANRLAHRVAFG